MQETKDVEVQVVLNFIESDQYSTAAKKAEGGLLVYVTSLQNAKFLFLCLGVSPGRPQDTAFRINPDSSKRIRTV